MKVRERKNLRIYNLRTILLMGVYAEGGILYEGMCAGGGGAVNGHAEVKYSYRNWQIRKFVYMYY